MKRLKLYNHFVFENNTKLPTPEEINYIIQSEDRIKIGSGGNAIVFDIPNYPQYVLRVTKGVLNKPEEYKVTQIIPINFPVSFNCGQAVARTQHDGKFGKGSEPITILRKQKGKPAGGRGLSVEDYLKVIEIISNLPQESYNTLAKEVVEIMNNNLQIDPSKPNNFLIDAENKKINIVDVNYSAGNTNCNIDWLISPLIDSASAGKLSEEDRKKFRPYWKQIISKIQTSLKPYPKLQSQKSVDKYVNWLIEPPKEETKDEETDW